MSPSDPPIRRVVVTGIGVVSPLGDREATWRGLCAGESAIRWLPELGYAGAPALGEPVAPEPIVSHALRAAEDAVHDAFGAEAILPSEAGCVIGDSKGGLRSVQRFLTGESAAWLDIWPNAPAVAVARRFNLTGPRLCPVAACATGLASLIRGADLIRNGECDVVLAGSTDASLEPILLASYRRMGVLSPTTAGTAERACRPFDRTRAGFAVGEGAAVLVLENLDTARARDARIYAEWLGDALAADPTHVTRLESDPASLTWLIRSALSRSRLTPPEIDYVNYHGTATRQNDLCETRAVHAAFGTAAREVVGSSLKGALGHALGAAGSLEMAMTLLGLRDGIVPPTANLNDPDPECDLDYSPRVARPRPLQTALKLSLGFGGHLAAAVVRRWC